MEKRIRFFYIKFLILVISFLGCSQVKSPSLKNKEIRSSKEHQAILDKAKKAFKEESYYEAVKYYESIANKSSIAAVSLSEIYASTLLGKVNYKKSFYWANLAASKKNPLGLYYSGVHYLSGKGIDRNPFLAYKLLQKSFRLGYVPAAYQLATIYFQGIGVEKNYSKARSWAKKGADKGDRRSMVFLGEMLYQGVGGKKDKKKGVQWLNKSKVN